MNRRELFRQAGAAAVSMTGAAAATAMRVRAFEPDGSPAGPARLNSLLLNRAGGPFEILPRVLGDGAAEIETPVEKFELTMILGVRDFGAVYLFADNAGTFYQGGQTGDLLLNYEFARSRAAFVRRYIKRVRTEGVVCTAAVTERLARGEAALARATAATEPRARAGFSNESLSETMWAGELAALEAARYRISRQGARPGFLFGCNAFGYARSDEYARRFSGLMNFATLPFYRGMTEKSEGSPDYSRVDAILGKMSGTSILAKGHPLVWFHRAGTPEFLKGKSWAELKRSCREYILASVGRYSTRIHAWDVINEAHDWANDLNLTQDQLLEMTRLAADTARAADPTCFRVVNSCCTWAEYVPRRRSYSGPLGRPARSPADYLLALKNAEVPYEAIGLQVYYPARDMLEIERQLHLFSEFGKPIHITELGASSSSEPAASGENRIPNRNVWHGAKWTEKIQADWLEQFYTICYSKPEIQAVTWWDFADPAFIPHGGLLDSDLRPKPAYERLAKLLAEWRHS